MGPRGPHKGRKKNIYIYIYKTRNRIEQVVVKGNATSKTTWTRLRMKIGLFRNNNNKAWDIKHNYNGREKGKRKGRLKEDII